MEDRGFVSVVSFAISFLLFSSRLWKGRNLLIWRRIEQFALTEAAYVTVRLMQAFEGIESRDPLPWREKLSLTCVGLGGCKVVLTPRKEE